MIVFVAGMARSGSMWTFNIARSLLACAGKEVLPEDIPSEEGSLINQLLLTPPPEDVFYCIKTHYPIEPNIPNVKIICNYRDVREAMLSFMRFTHSDFEKGMQIVQGMMSLTDFYFEKHTSDIIRLRYERIIHEPLTVIEEINKFLDLPVSKEDILRISEIFSKGNVKKFIESFDSSEININRLNLQLDKDFKLVHNFDGSTRIYHKKTAFQSNHITGRGERWRTELSEAQKKRLMGLTSDWLTKYQFIL